MTERRNKYNATQTIGDDRVAVYDSRLERDVARVLDLLVQQRRIQYDRQVPFVLAPRARGQRSVRYVADFLVHALGRPGCCVVVEVRGIDSPAGRLKVRWFMDKYVDIPLRVVRAPEEVIGVIEDLERDAGGPGCGTF